MKSIMEQASSVEKAVAKAWERAQFPSSFSIKILEKPQTNFFGMTTKSAKVALFYTEPAVKEHGARPSKRRREPKKPQVAQKKERKTGQKTDQTEWSPAMIDAAQVWVQEVLKKLNKQDRTFTVLRKNAHLVFLFNKPFFDDTESERLLFSSFALLMLKSLRIKFKSIKNLKVVFQQKA